MKGKKKHESMLTCTERGHHTASLIIDICAYLSCAACQSALKLKYTLGSHRLAQSSTQSSGELDWFDLSHG